MKYTHAVGSAFKFCLFGLLLSIAANGPSLASQSLRDWINDKSNLGKFGSVIAEPKVQQNNSQVYYFQMNVDFPSASHRMLITITCTQTKEPAAFCSASSTTGAPPDFPPAFVAPVFP
jgi:hypothetical protein